MKINLIKFLLGWMFIALCQPAQAQLYLWYSQPYTIIYDEETNAQNAAKSHFNYKEISIQETKKSWRNIYNYDREGRLVSFLTEKKGTGATKGGSRGFLVMYAYPDKTLKQKIFYFKNQVTFRTDSFDYNLFGKMTTFTVFDKHMIPQKQDQYEYDSTRVLTHQFSRYKKGLKKINQKQVYDYDGSKQLSKITYYNKNGKAYLKTVFDCNPRGANHKISKDSAYFCEKFDIDSLGNRMTITIETLKNRSTKKIAYYNKENKIIAFKYFNLKKDQPVYYVFFNPENGMRTGYINFRKGKEYFRSESKLDDKNNLIEKTEFFRNKLYYTLKNDYNTDGLLVSAKGYNSKNKLTKTITYVYGSKE